MSDVSGHLHLEFDDEGSERPLPFEGLSSEGFALSGGQRGRVRAGAGEKIEAGQTQTWSLEPHICRSCFSRLVSQPGTDGNTRYQCTNCGIEASGVEASALCCCGLKIRRPTKLHKSGHHLVDAGVRCAPNPNIRPDFPSLFIACEP